MRLRLSSTYIQVLSLFLLIILFTLAVSTFIEYRTYTSQLPTLITEIRTREIARQLSQIYSRNGSWNDTRAEISGIINPAGAVLYDEASLRVIIRDANGRSVYNSFMEVPEIGNTELIEGKSEAVKDYRTGEEAGVVTVYIGRAYIEKHARSYAGGLINPGLYKILLTTAAALALSLVFARRITGPIVKLTASVQDITEGREGGTVSVESTLELEKLSRAFNRMLLSLKKQRELRKQLLSEVSHEINTPLNTIRLEAKALTDGLIQPQEAGTNIISEIDALTNIVYDIDWIAETDRGNLKLNREHCSLPGLIYEEANRWRHKAAVRSQIIEVLDCPQELPELFIDPVRISAVVGNLISNAVKYSPENGHIRVGWSLNTGSATIFVCDEGTAIKKDQRTEIFRRCYRSDKHTGSRLPGRGLGLAIAARIVEMHDGEIHLECGEKRGNCFRFTLPAAEINSRG